MILGNIEITDKNIISKIHMNYWIGGKDQGPTLQEALCGVTYYPETRTAYFEGYELDTQDYPPFNTDLVGKDALHNEIIQSAMETDWPDMPNTIGRILWVSWDTGEGSVATYFGSGVWITETGTRIMFNDITEFSEVDIEINQSIL